MKEYDTISIGQANILNKIDTSVERYKIFAETLVNNPLDIVCLQEVASPKALIEIMGDLGYFYHIKSDLIVHNDNMADSLAIFSKYPIQKIDFINSYDQRVMAGRVKVDNRFYNIFSAHLSWGPDNGYERLAQVSLIDRVARAFELSDKDSVSVLCGDLNADPESRPVRFLKGWDLGVDNVSSTLWMDAHSEAGDESNWTTSDHSVNHYGVQTALRHKIVYTDFLPQRRIDYIFSRGWLYGKSGYPVEFGRLHHPENKIFSDHDAIYSRLLVVK